MNKIWIVAVVACAALMVACGGSEKKTEKKAEKVQDPVIASLVKIYEDGLAKLNTCKGDIGAGYDVYYEMKDQLVVLVTENLGKSTTSDNELNDKYCSEVAGNADVRKAKAAWEEEFINVNYEYHITIRNGIYWATDGRLGTLR